MALSRETVQAVKERADIVQVIGERVALTRTGADFKGLCPFHAEKTPSFIVSPSRRMYKCFGCDAGGSVVDFVMAYERLSFPEALRALAERWGIPIDQTATAAPRDRGGDAIQAAQAFYHQRLLSDGAAQAARDYLLGRGFTEQDWRAFGLGHAPDAWQGVLELGQAKGFASQDLLAGGLIRAADSGRQYDFLRNRITFPIQDERGRTIAFGGRAIAPDDTPKYLNTPDTRFYHKQQVLYGLAQGGEALRRSRRAILCEGYLDVIRLHGAGFPEAMATCGTALSVQHLQLLERYADRVVLVFDGDAAGIKAALRSAPLFLDSGLEARVITLPDGLDPDDFLAQQGQAAFATLLERAVPILEYAALQTLRQHGSSIQGRTRTLEALVPILAGIHKQAVRDMTTRYVADLIEVDVSTVAMAVRGAPARVTAPASRQARPDGHAPPTAKTQAPTQPGAGPVKPPRHQRRVLSCLLREHILLTQARELLRPEEFDDAALRSFYEQLLRLEDEEFAQLDSDELIWMFPEGEGLIRALLLENPLHMSAVQNHAAVLHESAYRIKLERKQRLLQQLRKVSGTDEEELAFRRVMRINEELTALRGKPVPAEKATAPDA